MSDIKLGIAIGLGFIGVIVSVYSMYRGPRTGYVSREKQLENEVQELKNAFEALLRKFGSTEQELTQLRNDLVKAQTEAHQTKDLLAQANQEIADLKGQLIAAQREATVMSRDLTKAEGRIKELETLVQDRQGKVKPVGDILVGIGVDERLQVDLAALRAVQARTLLRVTRLMPVSKVNLERTLNRHRTEGRPIRYVHLAVHAGAEGLLLKDGLADGVWLSGVLAGVEVLMIAGCSSDAVGDLLGVVPARVSMREEVSHEDARLFCELFWMAIGDGLEPLMAFERAVDRCPPTVAEFVELHQ